MNAVKPLLPLMSSPVPQSPTIETTLYDLIAAIAAEVTPGEEALVTAAVVDLLSSYGSNFWGHRRMAQADYEKANHLSAGSAAWNKSQALEAHPLATRGRMSSSL